jgi:hypothetical protein
MSANTATATKATRVRKPKVVPSSVPSVQLELEPEPVPSVQLEPEPAAQEPEPAAQEPEPAAQEPEPAAQEPEPVLELKPKKPRAPRTKGTESSRLGACATIDATTTDDATDAPIDAPTDAPIDAPTDAPIDAPVDAPVDGVTRRSKAPRPRAKKVLPEPVFEKPAPEIYDRISNLIVNSKFKLPARLPANYVSLSSVDSYLFAKTKNESEQTAAEKKIIRDVIKLIEKDDKAIAKAQKDAAKAQKATTNKNKKPTTNANKNKKPTLTQIIANKDAIIAHLQSILITNNIPFDITNINITNYTNYDATTDNNLSDNNATNANDTTDTGDNDTGDTDNENPWTEHFSQKHQKPYWYNNLTKLSSWIKPIDA